MAICFYFFKRIKIAIASNINNIPITIKRMLRIFDNPKLLSGRELVTVAEEVLLPEVFDVFVLE